MSKKNGEFVPYPGGSKASIEDRKTLEVAMKDLDLIEGADEEKKRAIEMVIIGQAKLRENQEHWRKNPFTPECVADTHMFPDSQRKARQFPP